MTRNTQKHTKPDQKSASDTATGMLEQGLSGLQQYIERTSVEVADTVNSDVADAFARVLTKAAQVSAELRKADAEERRRSELVTPESVLAAFRSLTARERAAVTGEIERMSTGRSGLA